MSRYPTYVALGIVVGIAVTAIVTTLPVKMLIVTGKVKSASFKDMAFNMYMAFFGFNLLFYGLWVLLGLGVIWLSVDKNKSVLMRQFIVVGVISFLVIHLIGFFTYMYVFVRHSRYFEPEEPAPTTVQEESLSACDLAASMEHNACAAVSNGVLQLFSAILAGLAVLGFVFVKDNMS